MKLMKLKRETALHLKYSLHFGGMQKKFYLEKIPTQEKKSLNVRKK